MAGVGTRWLLRPFPTKIILWFYDYCITKTWLHELFKLPWFMEKDEECCTRHLVDFLMFHSRLFSWGIHKQPMSSLCFLHLYWDIWIFSRTLWTVTEFTSIWCQKISKDHCLEKNFLWRCSSSWYFSVLDTPSYHFCLKGWIQRSDLEQLKNLS